MLIARLEQTKSWQIWHKIKLLCKKKLRLKMALGLGPMLTDGPQPFLGVLTLNRYALQLAGQQWVARSQPIGSRLHAPSSLLNYSQQEAHSAASPILCTATLCSLPITPSVVSTDHTDTAGNPLHPTSIGNSHACQPFSLHSMMRFWHSKLLRPAPPGWSWSWLSSPRMSAFLLWWTALMVLMTSVVLVS